jgi:Tfp pilus assembly protein PilE
MTRDTGGTILGLIAVLFLLGILAGLAPQAFSYVNQNNIDSVRMTVGESEDLQAPFQAVLQDKVNPPTNNHINLTLYDTENGKSAQITKLDETNSTQPTFFSESVNVTYVSSVNTNSAVVKFDFPVFYGWGDMAKFLVSFLITAIIAIFMYMIYVLVFEGANT